MTPWISVSVTIFPLATWATSCASTASASSRVMLCSRPVETATSELLRLGPVVNALGSPSEITTCGIGRFAVSARRCTVSTSQTSVGFCGVSITFVPVDHLVMILDIHSEMNAPPKPISIANISRRPRSSHAPVKKRWAPVSVLTTPSTSRMARLVPMSKSVRFMVRVVSEIASSVVEVHGSGRFRFSFACFICAAFSKNPSFAR